MRLIVFDFDGTIHLKETLRLYLKVLTDKTPTPIEKTDIYQSVENLCCNICQRCGGYESCWGEHFYATYREVFDLFTVLRTDGPLTSHSIQGRLTTECRRKKELVSEIHRLAHSNESGPTPRFWESDSRIRRRIRVFYLTNIGFYVAYRVGIFKQFMIKQGTKGVARIFRGLSQTEVHRFFKICVESAKPNFSPVSLQKINAHLRAGDQILLLSGAFSTLIGMVAKDLGMHYCIGTELEFKSGICTGRVRSQIQGSSKAESLKSFLQLQKDKGKTFDLSESYAYADGIRDLPLLQMVGHPVAVNPDQQLLKEARKRGWEIIRDVDNVIQMPNR